MTRPVYLDYNATTPHDPEVIAAMRPYLEERFGNPSSAHGYGAQAKQAIEQARRQVAALLHGRPEEIIFTSGGTESNNHAITGAALAHKDHGNHIITSQIEHPAVLEVCRFLERQGFEVTYLPVDAQGMISVSDVEQAVRPTTILITLMHANNEVGTLQPIEAVARIARQRRVLLHTDAAQSVGKIPAEVQRLGVDLLSLAGHKLYAPKGVGALYIRQGVQLAAFMHGAGQEQGRRAGTENVLEIVGLGKACEIAQRDMDCNARHLNAMRDRLYAGLSERLKEIRLNGHPQQRLPNTLSLSFKGVEAPQLLAAIRDQVAASAGAACHAGGVDLSHVLTAMNIPEEWARGTVRFSVGKMTTPEEIDQAIRVVSDAVTAGRRART